MEGDFWTVWRLQVGTWKHAAELMHEPLMILTIIAAFYVHLAFASIVMHGVIAIVHAFILYHALSFKSVPPETIGDDTYTFPSWWERVVEQIKIQNFVCWLWINLVIPIYTIDKEKIKFFL